MTVKSFLSGLLAVLVACGTSDEARAPEQVSIVEDLRLDANTEDFSSVGRVVVGTKDEIIVPLWEDAQLRIYDSTGKRIASVGRKGEAPGEFRYIGQVGLKADTIWAQDAETRQFTYFTPKGDLIRTGGLPGTLSQSTAYNAKGQYYFVIAIGVHPDGSMLASGRNRTPGQTRGSSSEMLHLTADGEIRPIGVQPNYEDKRWMMEVAGLGRQIPFTGEPLSATAADASRFAYAVTNLNSSDGGVYTITVFRANGDTVFSKGFPYKGVPIPQSAKDSAANAELSNEAPTEGPSDLDQRFKKLALEKMPPVYAPLQSILLGMDETVWVTLRDSAGVRPVIVLDAKGEVLGRVEISPRQRIRQATSTRIWVTELDDADLASVVRYKVHGIKGGNR